MKSFVNFSQLLVGDVRVHLRGGDGLVPEQFLHAAQIGTVRKEDRWRREWRRVCGVTFLARPAARAYFEIMCWM